MNRRTFLYTSVAAIAGAGGYLALQRSEPAAGSNLLAGMANAQSAEADTSRVEEMSLGNPDAKVTVIEYASFTCPHCRAFHAGPFKQLKENYIDTGKIHFIYREVYFDRFGLWAAMLARCAGADRYFAVADMIYETQQEWVAGGEPAKIADNLRRLGRTAGMEDDKINACLQDAEMAQAMVAVYQKNAEADGINSTPSFVIDGEKYTNMSYADFSALLDDKLGG